AAVLRVFDANHDQNVRTAQAHHGLNLSLAVSPDGSSLATCGYDGSIRVWKTETLEQFSSLRGPPGKANAVCFTPDSRNIISLAPNGQIRSRSFAGAIPAALPGPIDQLRGLAVSPDGERLLV